MTACTCAPSGGSPQCVRSVNCPEHNKGMCAEREAHGPATHFGPDFLGSVSHKGRREDCTYPDCGWPRTGDLVTAMSGGVERTGELVDFHIIRVSEGNEEVITPSTIRRPDKGTYCRHGLKIVEAVPAEHTFQEQRPLCTLGMNDPGHHCIENKYCPACYPAYRKVQPWPCHEDGCTEADFDREMETEAEEYWSSVNDLMRTMYE